MIRSHSYTISIVIFISSLFLTSTQVLAQTNHMQELEVYGKIIDMGTEKKLKLNWGMQYNYWFNPYIGLSGGLGINYNNTEVSFKSPIESNAVYYWGERNDTKFECSVGMRLSTSITAKFGAIVDVLLKFEPIPL